MRIGIVGGSIAGCSAAFLFMREGHEVMIFERSNTALVGRGGGIGTTAALMNEIKQRGLIPDDFSSFSISKMPFIGKLKSAEPYGKTAWSLPLSFEVFQWNELWQKLRNNIPDNCYRSGTKIIGARPGREDRVTLSIDGSDSELFDLVLFADGYNSLGRRILFPDKHLKYRGYVLWRGLLPERELGGSSFLNNQILRLSYKNNPGHNVVYFIPNQDGSVKEGERIYNWAAYITIPENELDKWMTDRSGRIRTGALPPGTMNEKNEAALKEFLTGNIPSHYGEIVNKTTDSYIQVIYTLDLEAYYSDRMCLVGDAGMVIQPFTGSGVFKGYNNVKDLIESLKNHDTLEMALKNWSRMQVINGKKLLALGEQMEKAFIWEQLDFSTATKEETANWWKSSVKFPENFSYERQ